MSITAAIIVAAGFSRRMGSACKDKLLLKINNIEILARTLLRYQKAESINRIYVVTREDLMETVQNLVEQYGITKFDGVTRGGATRQESVQAGLSLCAGADYVAIADGVRPFTKPQDIDRVTEAAKKWGGALLCVPVKDTVKMIGANGLIASTPPRADLLLAQTPQTFDRAVFTQLMDRAIRENKSVTDDASIYEMYGQQVMPVIGDYDNIKITTAEDISQAETIAGKDDI